jgi:predicted nucleic acid-binding protein
MSIKYILDACALNAHYRAEKGFEVVKEMFFKARACDIELYMNRVNMLEVYYDIRRSFDSDKAFEFYKNTLLLPIEIISEISDITFFESGRLKSDYRMSLADSILLGEAINLNAIVVTSDHKDFDIIEKNENIEFLWTK